MISKSVRSVSMKLVEDYMLLRNKGYTPGEILKDTAMSIVDYSVQPGERDLKIGDKLTIKGLVENLCALHGIMGDSYIHELKGKTRRFSMDKMVSELMDKGYTEELAKNLAQEYGA